MADSAHWIHVPPYGSDAPREVGEQEVVDALMSSKARVDKEAYHLVPGRVWRDYKETAERLAAMRTELNGYGTPKLVAVAERPPKPQPICNANEKASSIGEEAGGNSL